MELGGYGTRQVHGEWSFWTPHEEAHVSEWEQARNAGLP